MYNVSETVLPIYINGQCPIIKTCSDVTLNLSSKDSTDKQNALRRECTFKIEIVLEIGVAGVFIYLVISVLTLLNVVARLPQSVKALQMWHIFNSFANESEGHAFEPHH